MTTNQPPTVEERLSRLETLFVNVGEKVAEHDGTIDVLLTNIQDLRETVQNLTEQTTRNINRLAEEAAQDRQQAATDRQEIRRWEYLRDRNGGSPPLQAN